MADTDSSLWKWVVGILAGLLIGGWVGYVFQGQRGQVLTSGVPIQVTSAKNVTFFMPDSTAEPDGGARWTIKLKATNGATETYTFVGGTGSDNHSLPIGNWSVDVVTRTPSSGPAITYTPLVPTNNLIVVTDGTKKYYFVPVSDSTGARFITPVGLKDS